MTPASRRLALIALALLLALGAAVAGYRLALQRLQGALAQALGPNASVGALRVGWRGLEASEVRIRAASHASSKRGDWPAEDELRARRIVVEPALDSLWRDGWRLRRITVEGGYVSALRTRDGRLRLLPSLLETKSQAPLPALAIGEVVLADAALELYDASVRQPPWRVRLEGLQASAGPIVLPALDEALQVELHGVLKGVRHDGRLDVSGALTPATRDAALDVRLAGVDLLALQPYLLQVADAGVRRGRLDLELQARVARQRLHAPGVLTLDDLELASGNGLLGRFAGVPRDAVLAALRRDGRIRIRFALDGRLDDPAFSLNESLATRVASGLADSLGVSLAGVVHGVGNVVKGLFGR